MSKFKAGDKVRFVNTEARDSTPEYCPPVGTVGTVFTVCGEAEYVVQWPSGTTIGDGRWSASESEIAACRFLKTIAVDFDGTLHDGHWPDIGNIREEVFDKLLEEQREGASVILWTCRSGKELREAVEWCERNGLVFDAVNENLASVIEAFGGEDTRKIVADEYWDDLSVQLPGKKSRKDTPATRSETLDAAKKCVCGERENEYGSPEDSFASIASHWSTYLSRACLDGGQRILVKPHDVAAMMALLKIARLESGTGTADSWVDLAGYAACGCELFAMPESGEENEKENK